MTWQRIELILGFAGFSTISITIFSLGSWENIHFQGASGIVEYTLLNVLGFSCVACSIGNLARIVKDSWMSFTPK
jgi:hypothetical protein